MRELRSTELDAIIRRDPIYMDCLEKLKRLEPCYSAVLSKVSITEEDVLCDFLNLCEEMSERKLELLCQSLGVLLIK